MTYEEVSAAARHLTYRDKLKLAELLIQLAREEVEEHAIGSRSALSDYEASVDSNLINENSEASTNGIDPNRPWVGRYYHSRRIFVVGESFTGTYEGDLAYDDFYMAALVDGNELPGSELFFKMAEKLKMSVAEFWNQVAFTNLALGSIGPTNATKVTPAQLRAGLPRLEALFRRLEPKGVLFLGVKTGEAAAPLCSRLGVIHRTVYHPSGVNNANPRTACTAEMLQGAWNELTSTMAQ